MYCWHPKQNIPWHHKLKYGLYQSQIKSSKDSSTVSDAEMRNFSAAECGKAIKGNLWNVPRLIFRKLAVDSFPHSAVRIPRATRARKCLLPLMHGRWVGGGGDDAVCLIM